MTDDREPARRKAGTNVYAKVWVARERRFDEWIGGDLDAWCHMEIWLRVARMSTTCIRLSGGREFLVWSREAFASSEQFQEFPRKLSSSLFHFYHIVHTRTKKWRIKIYSARRFYYTRVPFWRYWYLLCAKFTKVSRIFVICIVRACCKTYCKTRHDCHDHDWSSLKQIWNAISKSTQYTCTKYIRESSSIMDFQLPLLSYHCTCRQWTFHLDD